MFALNSCSNSIVLVRTVWNTLLSCKDIYKTPFLVHQITNVVYPLAYSSSDHIDQDVVPLLAVLLPALQKITPNSPSVPRMSSSSGQKSKPGTRNKKHKSWAARERAGMSFLFVLAFFAVFGIIILTEVGGDD